MEFGIRMIRIASRGVRAGELPSFKSGTLADLPGEVCTDAEAFESLYCIRRKRKNFTGPKDALLKGMGGLGTIDHGPDMASPLSRTRVDCGDQTSVVLLPAEKICNWGSRVRMAERLHVVPQSFEIATL
jgi:hypothetical protein